MIAVVLIVLVTSITFGIKLTSVSNGTDGMMIITFALSFLSIVLSFLIFTQVLHLKDHLLQLIAEKEKLSEQKIVQPKKK